MQKRCFVKLVGGLFLVALIATATACGGGEESGSAAEVDQASTASPPTAAPQPSPTARPAATVVTVDATQAPESSDDSSESSDAESSGLDRSSYANASTSSEVTYVTDGDERYDIRNVLPRDAIQAIFEPRLFTTDLAVDQYRNTDLIIGVSINGDHRAYNVAHLSSHEVVNDVIGGKPVAVTW